jgi:hypothetical protein
MAQFLSAFPISDAKRSHSVVRAHDAARVVFEGRTNGLGAAHGGEDGPPSVTTELAQSNATKQLLTFGLADGVLSTL